MALDKPIKIRTSEGWQDLAQAGPPGEGVPEGGATGQFLHKISAADFDTEWVDPPAGGGGTGGEPTGPAGGVLGGFYPNPGFAADMATQAELDAMSSSVSAAATAHAADTTAIHGIADTALLATDAEVAAAVTAHEADTSVHGIADTTALATDAEVTSAISTHTADTTAVHGIADTSALALSAAHPTNTVFNDHSARHENSGADEISVAGLSGLLADAQTPTAHAHSGADITSGTVAEARIDAAIARDTEVTSAITTHAGAADPHTIYQKEAERGVANGYASLDASTLIPDAQIPSTITRDSELSAHEADTTNVHGIADVAALATDAEVATAISNHAGLADPHTGYQKESEKGVASGYASLDASVLVPLAQIPTITAAKVAADVATQAELDALAATVATDAEVTSAIAAHAALSDPHTVYQRESEKGTVNGYASLDASGLVPDAQIPASITRDSELSGYASSAAIASAVSAHEADTSSVHGITDTTVLETVSGAQGKVDTHSADTTAVHGIADTSVLATQSALSLSIATRVAYSEYGTNKGGILVGTASPDNPDMLSVGANGRIPIADSTQALGLKWGWPGEGVPFVTALPGSPVDGQECILCDSLTLPTYTWHMRYYAASTSSFKWKFLGGSPARAGIAGTGTFTTVGSAVDATAAGPGVTVPAGVYLLEGVASFTKSATDVNVQLHIGTTGSPSAASGIGGIYLASSYTSIKAMNEFTNPTAAEIRLRYAQFAAGTMTVLNRYLKITPIRL